MKKRPVTRDDNNYNNNNNNNNTATMWHGAQFNTRTSLRLLYHNPRTSTNVLQIVSSNSHLTMLVRCGLVTGEEVV